MAYNQRFLIRQKLRDDSVLSVKIYDKNYSGSTIIEYTATSIILQSNASNDEPIAGILASQLNISFLVSQEDGTNFPDLLSFDDTRYFVKLFKDSTLLWCGYLFNDYVQVPFSTGWMQVDLIATDGLSLLKAPKYNYVTDTYVTTLISLIDIISNSINQISFPDPINVITSCSYYASGMNNRADGTQYDPFAQSYLYIRDINNLSYYDVLNNVVTSLGCRMMQSDGKWQILAINEMANATRYYTEYSTNPTTVVSSGTLDKNYTIQPYSSGNIHFINNSQAKIVRKGYPKLLVNHSFNYPSNYLHNGTFKGLNGDPTSPNTNSLYGWYLYSSAAYPTNCIQIDNTSDYNDVLLQTPTTGSAREMYIQNAAQSPYDQFLYCPIMTSPSFSFSFEYLKPHSDNNISVEIKLVGSFGGYPSTYYYNSGTNNWQTTQHYNTISLNNEYDYLKFGAWTQYSMNVSMEYPSTLGSTGYLYWNGHIFVKIKTSDTDGYRFITIRNLKIVQNSNNYSAYQNTSLIGTNKNVVEKDIEQPYGTYYLYPKSDVENIVVPALGVLYDYNGNWLQNWYRYPNTESFTQLQDLITRQYSNLLNHNYGTLEGELGKFTDTKGMIYLDKVYQIQDSATNVLSYNGKKFLMNRGNITARVDEVNSMQVIEVDNTDTDITITSKYITQ